MIPRVAVVIAGGLGTRIAAVAGDSPKVLLSVGDRPFLEVKLDELVRENVAAAVLLTGHKSEAVHAYLQSHMTSIPIAIVSDGPQLLGTGGALVRALPFLPDSFFVTYGDALLDVSYELVQTTANNGDRQMSTLVVTLPRLGFDDKTNTVVVGEHVVEHDKTKRSPEMRWLDYGLALLVKSDLLDLELPAQSFDLSLIYAQLANKKILRAVITNDPYWETGTPSSLELVRQEWQNRYP